ncbi:MBG domain-containing protein [Algoriphagus sp. Y33]|uniref:MBG domain-containing protein n=1 Tax=Algoriphagus sp. Y33 TaxID=2772483 RepID=UPI001784A883|nr:MBG domain-containing protein [Algoriphagus sp. Y33]
MRHFSFLLLLIGLIFNHLSIASNQEVQQQFHLERASQNLFIDSINHSGTASKTLDQPAPEEFSLAFTQNQGQWQDNVLAMANGSGFRLWVTLDGLMYDFMNISSLDSTVLGHVVAMDFNSTHSGFVSFNNELDGVANYYNGSDSSQWFEKVPQFGEVLLNNVYEGISLRIYGEKGLPRYDFIVEPGADVALINLDINGAENLHLDRNGDLNYLTSLGKVKQTDLFTYQLIDGEKRKIASSFSFDKKGSVGFEVGEYDPALPLVIDPLVYSTFIGSPSAIGVGISGGAIEVEDGFVYAAGITSYTDYPTTVGAYKSSFAEGSTAMYITKLNKTGTALIYSTFLAEGSTFSLGDMAVENGYVYLTGAAYAGFPTTENAYQKEFSSGGGFLGLVDPDTGEPVYEGIPGFGGLFNPTDAFLTKLSLDGGSLEYSTYLGGAGTDMANGLAVEDGYVYLTGLSGPQKEKNVPFPTTEGAYQRENGFGFLSNTLEESIENLVYQHLYDVFISKFSLDGSELLYSTLLGGDGLEAGNAIILQDGKAIVSGVSTVNFPVTPGAFMTEPKGGNDLFLLRMNESLSELEYSTLIAGSGDESVTRMGGDAENLYLLGTTSDAADFPTTPGSYLSSDANFKAPFLMKFSDFGENLVFSTFVGSLQGVDSELFTDLAVYKGVPYLSGYTTNLNFFTTDNAYQKSGAFQEEYSENPFNQSFVMRLLPSGQTLDYSTLFGGFATYINSIAVENGVVYLEGYSSKFGFEFSEDAYYDGSDITEFNEELLLQKKFVTAIDFELDQFAPEAPQLISPGNGAKKILIRPTFNWELAGNTMLNSTADSYTLQLSTTEDFSGAVIQHDGIEELTFDFTSDLDFGVKYYWRVRGEDAEDSGEWSAVFSFTTVPSEVGDGTVESPWEVGTPEQLNAVRSYLSGHFKVVADIDLSKVSREGGKYWNEGAGWQPIGDGSAPFIGNIAGEGYALEGVFINNSTANNVGIFGVIKDGSVKRLAILNPEITGGTVVGSLAALVVGGTIQECYVFEGYVSGDFFVGGLIGVLQTSESLLENSYSYLEIRQKTTPIPSGGGLVGNNQSGIIRNVYSLSTVAGEPVNNGAILGTGSPSPVQSYFNIELASPDNAKGEGLISAAMRQQASFEKWDFTNVWKIEEDSNFPVLIHNEQIPAPGQLGGVPDANNILYVDQSVDGGLSNGNSWENAYATLQQALAYTEVNWLGQDEVLKIYVAEGTYFPTEDTDETKTFQLFNNVEIYGGFPSGGGTFDSRNWKENQTILSGDIIARSTSLIESPFAFSNGNSLHVVSGSGTDASAILDGFYINAGFAIGDGEKSDGAGVFIKTGSPNLTNLMVIANRSGRYGGGMANSEGASPNLLNVIFKANYTSNGGGGMSNLASNPILEKVKFMENISAMNGGGLYNSSESSPELLNVDFVGNTSNGGAGTGNVGGGGMYSAGGSPILTNVRFSGNMALRNNARGGAILNNTSKTVLTNVTISGNTAYYGGGIYLTQSNNQPEIRNSIIWNNKDNTGIGTANSSLQLIGSVGPQITYSLIQAHDPAGEGNMDGTIAENDPGFVDPILTFGVSPILTGDFRLQSGSPAKSKGNQAYFVSGLIPDLGAVESDLDANSRFIGVLEMGAYEIQEDLEEIIISVLPNQSKAYGTEDPDEFLYESSNNAVSLTGSLGRVSGEDVGTYAITQGSLSAGENYTLIIQEQVFEITKKILEGVSLENQTFVYDGNPKSLTIVGELPEGATVSFENNYRTDVGTQQVRAIVSGADFIALILNAELEVTPADLTGITFESESFEFDGTPKTLQISGTLPVGTSVEYSNNGRTELGLQEVTATITGNNYKTLILKADLSIKPEKFDVIAIKSDPTGFGLSDGSIDLVVTGGVEPYTYSWTPSIGSSNKVENLPAGFYDFLVTDDEGEELQARVELRNPISSGVPVQSDFVTDALENCSVPQEVNFSDRSKNADTWRWNFGDGTIISSSYGFSPKNPKHTYTEPGDFTVSLTIQDTVTGVTSISSKIIKIRDVKADFEADKTIACGPNAVQFTDKSTEASSWLWDFGDGTSSTEQNPIHTFDHGRYSVRLTIYSDNGCSDTEEKIGFIEIFGPVIDFSSDVTEGCGPLTVAFTDKSYSGSPMVSWLWDFGDGTTSRLRNPIHEYANPGTYSVSLSVGNLDCPTPKTLTKTDLIQVKMLDVGISFTDVTCEGGADGSIIATPNDGVAPFTYEWSTGGETASIEGLTAGSYSLKVTDSNGCFETKVIEVTEPIPASLITVAATSITYSSATLGGEILNGLACAQETGIVYSTVSGPDISDTKEVIALEGNQFSGNVTGLQLNTMYYVRTFSTNQNGVTTYGNEVTFSTSKKVLEVTARSGQTKVYGNVDPSFTYTAEGFEAGDDERILSGELIREAGEEVGLYAIQQGQLEAGDNYTVSFTGAFFEITAAVVEDVSFNPASFTYDGTEKTLSITGTLPEGTSVSYTNNGRSDVGTQEVTATITGSNYNTLVLTADLTITPSDITEVRLDDASFVFDGTAKSLTVDGDLPEGTSVSYENNSRTNVGTQEVTATITGSDFTTLVLTADLTITPADITGITFDDASFVFDGTEKSLEITGELPDGTSVSYSENSRTNIGTQEVTATITGSNYNTLVLTADLTITPSDITEVTLDDASFVYDGSAKSLAIEGELPTGTAVAYINNSRTDVGTQEVTATITADNYTTLVLAADLTVTPATITDIIFEDASFVYDGTEKSFAIAGTLPAGTSVSYANNTRTNVGAQKATATISGSNFETLVLTADLTITPADISDITFVAQSFVFDGTEKSLAITGDLPAGTSVAYTNSGRTNVGTQEVTATITGSNFTTLVLTADLTITPATVTGITFEDDSFVYNGTAKALAITGTLPEGTSVSYTDNSRTDVGTQEVTATITGSNFTTLVLTADLTITPADITGITFEDDSFVYDGIAKSLAIEGELPEGTSVSYTDNSRTDVGTQEVAATITGSNYTTVVLTADLTITPATVTGITFEDDSFIYDGTAKVLAITGTLPDGTSVSYTNNSRTNVGTQEVTATITGSNYNALVLTADLTITPADITGITFEDDSFVYDGTAKALAITGTLPDGSSVSYADNSRTDVGIQEVTATITGSNYTTLVLTADLTITPADIAGVTFEDDSFVYDGTAKSLAITGTLPDGTSVSYTDNSRTDVGTQEVTVTITGSNYTTLVLTADLTITPADIAGVTFEDDSFVYDGTAKSLAISGTLPDGSSVSYTDNSRTDVGTQEVTATITGSNFTTLVLTADLTITPADIAGVTFEDDSFVYDGTAKSLAISGTLPDGTSVSYTDNSRTDVGTQEVTATITGSNYTTLVLTADLTITPATITDITFDDDSFVFDGTAKALSIDGELPEGTSVSYTNNSRTDVGTQEVTATITGSDFATLVLTADLTITPADISDITFVAQSFVFDGTEKSLAITGDLPAGTSVTYTNNSRTDVGTQEVTARITGDNYTTLVLTADLTVTPADITGIAFEDGSFVYDGTAKSLVITGTLPEGTSVAYTDNSRTEVGTQEVTATITGSDFTTLVLTADLTITPADITGVTFEDASFVFDGTEKSIEITGELPDGTSVSYSENSRTNVGTQEATATITGSNFTTLVLTADLTVTPADATDITLEDGSFVFDGTTKSLAISGILPEGTSVAYTNNSRTEVGSQEVTATITGSNFTTLALTADLSVTQATLTITVDKGLSKVVGEADPELTYAASGFATGEDEGVLNGSLERESGEEVGTYTIGIGTLTVGNNYTIAFTGAEFEILMEEEDEPDTITGFVAQSLEVLWGTPEAELNVPAETVVITSAGEFINLAVEWDLMGYDPLKAGIGSYLGTIEIPSGLINPDELQPTLEVTVLAKPAPEDVILSQNSFVAAPDQFFQEIGDFTVLDPTDDQHTFSLPEGVQDNQYFEVLDGILFWSSAEQAEGRTNFVITLQVTDRAENVLMKDFQITRERTPLDQLEIANTFTPNGDGVNDIWGVPALRYYSGVRISVFAVGGKRLFYTEDPDLRWDGMFNGREMPVGAYLYVIEVGETGEVKRGMLNLLSK